MLRRELVAASAEPMILALLAKNDNYGYGILRDIERLTGDQIAWTEGMLYPVLHRLERAKKIRSQWREVESGRKRKYYGISPKGKTALTKMMDEWSLVYRALTELTELRHV
jgi:DNA-binding PadR family transcriptional regulator